MAKDSRDDTEVADPYTMQLIGMSGLVMANAFLFGGHFLLLSGAFAVLGMGGIFLVGMLPCCSLVLPWLSFLVFVAGLEKEGRLSPRGLQVAVLLSAVLGAIGKLAGPSLIGMIPGVDLFLYRNAGVGLGADAPLQLALAMAVALSAPRRPDQPEELR